jgi:hypothetical protein
LKNSAVAAGAATMGASMMAKGAKAFEEQGEGSGSLRRDQVGLEFVSLRWPFFFCRFQLAETRTYALDCRGHNKDFCFLARCDGTVRVPPVSTRAGNVEIHPSLDVPAR